MLPDHIDQSLAYRRYLTSKDIPKQFGANGEKLCRWCLKPLSGRRTAWCSEECVGQYSVRAGFTAAYNTLTRDKYKCVLCGNYGGEVDHIVPVIEGGGCCGIDNLRTLCSTCHRLETNALMKRLSARRKEIKKKLQDMKAFFSTEFGWYVAS